MNNKKVEWESFSKLNFSTSKDKIRAKKQTIVLKNVKTKLFNQKWLTFFKLNLQTEKIQCSKNLHTKFQNLANLTIQKDKKPRKKILKYNIVFSKRCVSY